MTYCPLIACLLVGAGQPDRQVIENEHVAAVLNRGLITSLVDKQTGRELVAAPDAAPLFRFEYSEPDKSGTARTTCHSAQAERVRFEPWTRGTDRGLRAVYSGFEGRPIEITCTLFTRGQERSLRFGLEAVLPPGLSVESVSYPMVSLRLPFAPGKNVTAVVGSGGGGLLHPAEWPIGQLRRFDQPGKLAAAFGCAYDDAGGLYTAACDGRGQRKGLIMKRRTADALECGWHHPCFARARFQLDYEIVLAGFSSSERARPTDWRDAADLYKAWATQQSWCARTFAERDDLPGWVKQGPAITRFTRSWLVNPPSVAAWLRDYWAKEFPQRRPLVIAYWGWEKVGKWVGPDYFPPYPSRQGFEQLVALGRELGGRSFLWPSGYNYTLAYGRRADGSYLWDNRAAFDAVARPHAVVGRDGEPQVRDCTWLRGGQNCPMCPGDPWTIDWLNQAAVGCVRLGAEVVQIDQAVGGNFPPCYSPTHPHPAGPGLWATEAFRRQLQTMTRACRAVEPESVVGFEQPNEWFLQDVGIQDYRDCDVIWSGQEPASVFAYLYHEYMPILFQSNRPQTGHDPLAIAWCLVQGQMPHFAPRIGLGAGPMVVDGGFEQATDEGPVEFGRTLMFPGDRWYSGETGIDRTVYHGGQASLKLFNVQPGGGVLAAQNYEVGETFRPGRNYRLSVWMRTSQVAPPNGVLLKALGPGMTLLESWQIPYPANQPEWTRRHVDFSMPDGTCTLRVMLAFDGAGAVWLDDLAIEEVRPDGTVAKVERSQKPTDHELMRQWLELYQGAGQRYLLLGKMLRPPHLDAVATVQVGTRRFPAVLHNAFRAPDGAEGVVLVNWTTKPQAVSFAWQGRTRSIRLSPGQVRLEE